MNKEKNVWAIASLIAFWWLAPNQINAQQDSIKTQDLSDVVITASRQGTVLLETPRTVSVITQEQIQMSAFNSVGDLLQQQSGLYLVGANQNPGANQSLFMRGANANQVVILIDGVRITDPSSPNNVIDLSELSLTNVERIEQVEGSHSTMYGGSAVGGVINIITKKGSGEGVHGSLSSQAGTYGKATGSHLQNIEIDYGHRNGFYFSASQVEQYVHGLNASLEPTPANINTPERDDFRKTDRYAKAGYTMNLWDAFIGYKKTNQHADIDNGAFQDKTNNELSFNRDFVQYAVSYGLSPAWKLSVNGSWSESNRTQENDSSKLQTGNYDGSYFKGTYTGKIQTHELQLTYHKNSLKGVAGAGVYTEDMHFNTYFYSSSFGGFSSSIDYDSVSTSTSTRYLFTQLTIRKEGSPFGITAGGRVSNNSQLGTNVTYELNPFYRLKSMMVYGSLSSGYSSPSLYQLFDPTQDFGSVTNRGNKDLKPEKSISIEMGVKREFNKGSFITASVFSTLTNNAIEYAYLWNKNKTPDALDYTDYLGDTYLNIAKQSVKGLEVEGSVRIFRIISFRGNATWLSGNLEFSRKDIPVAKTEGNHVQLYSNGSFVGAETERLNSLIRRPSFTAYGALNFNFTSSLTFTTDCRVASSRFDSVYDPVLGPYGALGRKSISAYALFNVSLNWTVNKTFSFTAKGENILNTDYSEIAGFATRSRSFYLKLNVRW